MTDTTFAGLGLADALLRALSAEGYERPTPIQAKSIPALLQGRDLLGIAQTGTGKTAAFALPILQKLSEKRERPQMKGARALILAPTRELVQQIAESFRTYGRNLGLTQAVVLGGVGMQPQIRALSRGVDILIATPGRLLDLIQQRACLLQTTTTLVLDEADRMLDMGFVRDVKRIVAMMPHQRQSLLFSATMPKDVEELARQMLIEPVRVEVTPPATTVELITQSVHHVDAGAKRDLLTELLADEKLRRVIVFTRTKHGADRVAKHLDRAGIRVDAIHGDKTQGARQRALHDFRDGKVRVLVATDIAARGIDVDGISHVINYELPNVPESYVHRIGRTARAGNDGAAIAFCSPEERSLLRDIERLTKKPLTVIGQAPAESSRQHGRDPHRQMQHRSRQGQGYAQGGGRNSNRPYGKRDDRQQSDGRSGEQRHDRYAGENRASGEQRQDGPRRSHDQGQGQGQGGFHRGGPSRGKPRQGGFQRPGRSGGGQRSNRVA